MIIFHHKTQYAVTTLMREWSDSRLSWLALKMIPNLGNITYKHLVERFGDPASVFKAKFNDLLEVEGLRVETAKRILGSAWEGNPQDELMSIEKSGIRLITMSDSS